MMSSCQEGTSKFFRNKLFPTQRASIPTEDRQGNVYKRIEQAFALVATFNAMITCRMVDRPVTGEVKGCRKYISLKLPNSV